MKAQIQHNKQSYSINLAKPLDISLALSSETSASSAWYCPPVKIEPVMTEHFIGDVNRGGAVNFRDIQFNPHGNGTHTECVGHISKEWYSVNQSLDKYFFMADLITIAPEKQENGDWVITEALLKEKLEDKPYTDALVLRTLPNTDAKTTRQYTETNPPFLSTTAMQYLVEREVQHFLLDLPSVDREFDEGALACHHIFWNYPQAPRLEATITELIYVPQEIEDGLYVLNIQMAALENDASPSRPVLYAVEPK